MPGTKPRQLWALIISLLAMSLPAWPVRGALPPDAAEFFESRIRPVLAQDCYECHSTKGKKKGGLALDYSDAVLAGGESGKVIDLANPKGSLLLRAIRHDVEDLQMPKARAKLDSQVIADFEKWVQMGAPDPRTSPPTEAQIAADTDWEAVMKRRKTWWSFQPIKKPNLAILPVTGLGGGHPIDRLVRARLAAAHLAPADRADRYTLLRRLSFALRGLPPSNAEIEAFATDRTEGAYDRQVDAFLASPRFGEQWARHWMDWIRYADSHGSEGDPMIPYAWRYRDYLIRALNADVPYDQLVREHLAGDLLKHPRINEDLGLNESALGIGHLRMVFHGFAPTDPLEEQVRFTDDQINVVSKAFLGLTVSCARCHNHKFDPISQKDFYGWYGVFVSCPPATIAVDAPRADGAKLRESLHRSADTAKNALAHAWLQRTNEISQLLTSPSPALQKAIDQAKELGSILHPFYILRHPDGKGGLNQVLERWREDLRNTTNPFPSAVVKRWSFESSSDFQKWRQDGAGAASVVPPGRYSLAAEGDGILTGIYPSGAYTHLDSTKDRGVLLSPRIMLDGKYDLWIRVLGEGGSLLRYAMQNYPRDGTVYPVERLNGNHWHWVKFGVDYWQGDRLHIEISTAADQPVLADINATRSWFGIREVRMTRTGTPAPSESFEFAEPILQALGALQPTNAVQLAEAYETAARKCIEAWIHASGVASPNTDGQAVFLDQLVKTGLLPNDLKKLPEMEPLVTQWRAIESKIPVPTRAQGVIETEPYDQPLFVRGDHKHPAEAVPRRFLDAIDNTPFGRHESGRQEFAEALLSPGNPLTARVIVNRVWHHLFGKGIVATTDNFGRLGQEPSNPELLDFLAGWFVEHGYSIKGLIRFIVTSDTWQLSSEPPANTAEKDPNNILLSHFNVKRQEAEAIRDTLLSVAGTLRESEMYGPPLLGKTPRRSVYLQVKRNDLDPFVSIFDAPAPTTTKGVRDVTNIPGQSLTLLNDPFVLELAERWSEHILHDASLETPKDRIRTMFLQSLGRWPSEAEVTRAAEFLKWSKEQQRQAVEDRAQLEQTIAKARNQAMEIAARADSRVLAQRKPSETAASTNKVEPLAAWDFANGLQDRQGVLNGRLINRAKIENKALVLDGNASYAVTAPLAQTLRAKTLEAWVQLSNLDQQGGGVMAIQDLTGNVFDAIVIGEKERRQWMAGSDSFNRTQSFDGPQEAEADERPVCLAIVYSEDGTITGYRNGQPYGKPYKSSGPAVFEAGKAQVLFGNRHGEPGGNRPLTGKIYRARLYNRALSAEEIEASASSDSNFVSNPERLAAMTAAERDEFDQLQAAAAQGEDQLKEAKRRQGLSNEWASLGHALFNLKEFIYVR